MLVEIYIIKHWRTKGIIRTTDYKVVTLEGMIKHRNQYYPKQQYKKTLNDANVEVEKRRNIHIQKIERMFKFFKNLVVPVIDG